MRKLLLAVPVLGLVALGAGACRTAQANAPATRPALEVPPPPPRVVEATPVQAEPPLAPVADLPPAPTAAARPRAQPPRDTARERPPEQKPETPPAAETAAPATPPAAQPAPQIRTPADNSETARLVREILDRTGATLEKIDYQRLSPQRRESYDDAKKFMREAEDAIKASNFSYALKLADKAETLARELQGR